MNVLALDLSLTSTGYVLPDGTPGLIAPLHTSGVERLAEITNTLLDWLPYHPAALVVIEGYAYGTPRGRQGHQYERAELVGILRLTCWQHGLPLADVPPAVLKRYATGKGNASKAEVLTAAVRRLNYPGSSNDEADALWLWHLAHDAYDQPTVTVPQSHRTVLRSVDWPELEAAA